MWHCVWRIIQRCGAGDQNIYIKHDIENQRTKQFHIPVVMDGRWVRMKAADAFWMENNESSRSIDRSIDR